MLASYISVLAPFSPSTHTHTCPVEASLQYYSVQSPNTDVTDQVRHGDIECDVGCDVGCGVCCASTALWGQSGGPTSSRVCDADRLWGAVTLRWVEYCSTL